MTKRFKYKGQEYKYVYIEGPIGRGKTTLAKKIKNKFLDKIILEEEVWMKSRLALDHGNSLVIYTGQPGDLKYLLGFLNPIDMLLLDLGEKSVLAHDAIVAEIKVVSYGEKPGKHKCHCELFSLLRNGCKCGGC